MPPLFFVFILLLFTTVSSSTAANTNTDRAALLAFRAAVAPSLLPSWSPSTSPCSSWHGVTCSNSRVVALRLPGAGLIGPIPSSTLSNLTELRTLSLRFNALSSPLPSDLSSLRSLRSLYLNSNLFSDNPSSLSSLSSLLRLNLADNRLSGPVPSSFKNLTRLRVLYLENNNLTGRIPDLNITSLTSFNASFNPLLSGPVPPSLAKFTKSSFLGLTGLCGGPFPPCPSQSPPPSPLSPSPLHPPPPANNNNINSTSASSSSKLSGGAIAGIAIGSVALLLILLIFLIFICRRKRGAASLKPAETRIGAAPVAGAAAAAPRVRAAASGPAKKLVFFRGRGEFDLEVLLRASAEVLGKGTFGTAYKAVMETGTVVAVKRLKDVGLSEREFREKVEAIGAMEHPNLVPLMAYYYSKEEKLLVYDYIPLGSLSALLHGNRGSGRTPLNWETRSAIALAAANGLAYIHSTSPNFSHGNIKSSNILLGKSTGDARVSDHGLAHLIDRAGPSSSGHATGYRAPEVTDSRRVSQKADVYSFGVLLMELLTAKAPAQAALNEDGDGLDLPRWVQSVVDEDRTAELFDVELLQQDQNQNVVQDDMVQLLRVAIHCASQHPDKRPSMSQVVAQIEDIGKSSNLRRASADPSTNGAEQHS